MKIKMLQTWASPRGVIAPGQEVVVEDELGFCLVKQGAASVVECVALPKVPTAAQIAPTQELETTEVPVELETTDKRRRKSKP